MYYCTERFLSSIRTLWFCLVFYYSAHVAFTTSLRSLHWSLIVRIVRKRFLIFSCFFLLFMHSRIASSCPVAPSIVLGAPGSFQTLIFYHHNRDYIHQFLASFGFVLLKLNIPPALCSEVLSLLLHGEVSQRWPHRLLFYACSINCSAVALPDMVTLRPSQFVWWNSVSSSKTPALTEAILWSDYSRPTASAQGSCAVWNTGTVPPADTNSRCRSSHTSQTGCSLLKKPGSTMPGIGAIGWLLLGLRRRMKWLYFTCFSLKPPLLPAMGRQKPSLQLPLGHIQTSSSAVTGAMSLDSEFKLLISRCWRWLTQAAQQLCWKTPALFSWG